MPLDKNKCPHEQNGCHYEGYCEHRTAPDKELNGTWLPTCRLKAKTIKELHVTCPDRYERSHIFELTVECRHPFTANLKTMGSCQLIRENNCCPRGFK